MTKTLPAALMESWLAAESPVCWPCVTGAGIRGWILNVDSVLWRLPLLEHAARCLDRRGLGAFVAGHTSNMPPFGVFCPWTARQHRPFAPRFDSGAAWRRRELIQQSAGGLVCVCMYWRMAERCSVKACLAAAT